MSRQLPPYPSLEHLKKQAKDLLPELQRHTPDRQLADAQHAIARMYGFANWTQLKTHVESLARPADHVATMPASRHPLAGTWKANLTKSTPHPDNPFQSATLEIVVDGDTVTITDVVIDASGREERGRNTLHADGVGLAYEHGYTVTTTWLSARALEATVTRNAQLEGRVTYEASADGQTLTLSTAEQMSVFDRS
jgi:endonuclease YncB( thermonuclease family)